jgi:hypothetical protein
VKKDVFDRYVEEVVSGRFINRKQDQFEELEDVARAYLVLTNEKGVRSEKDLTEEAALQKRMIELKLEAVERQLKRG